MLFSAHMYEYTTFSLSLGCILQKFIKKTGLTLFFGLMTWAILSYPKLSLSYALTGLNVWFQQMIPTLFPFMVLSGMMIRLRLSERFAGFFRPLLYPLFHVNNRCLYCIVMGFLCGFPMGAKITGDMYRMGQITRQEASFLLAFCNNIGPVFFTGFVLSFLPGDIPVWTYLAGMYGIPLLYGLLLRYLGYDGQIKANAASLSCTEKSPGFAAAMDASVSSGIQSITKLGGYMIIFNLWNLLPRLIFEKLPASYAFWQIPVCLLLEITGGITMAGPDHPLLILVMLQFGGLSCIAQTYCMISDTDLSLFSYILHNFCQSMLALFYYMAIFSFYL